MIRILTVLAIVIFWLTTIALGQDGKLEGYVFDDKGRPLADATVVIPGGDETTTDSEGHFWINFPSASRGGEPIKITVVKGNWVVFEPMFGNYPIQSLRTNSEMLTITVVAKGSPRFLEPARLSSLVGVIQTRMSLAINLGGGLDQSQRVRDEVLREYSEESGVSLDKLILALNEWSQIARSEINEEAALQEIAKEYWKRNYLKAAQLQLQSARDSTAQKQKSEELLKEKRNRVRNYLGAGNSFYEAGAFRDALIAFLELDKLFETGEFPREQLKSNWAELRLFIAKSKIELGVRVEGKEHLVFLQEALDECYKVLIIYTVEKFPERWARARQIEGWALFRLGERASGAESIEFLNKSAAAQRAADKELDHKKTGEKAALQQGLGLVLMELSERANGKERSAFLDEALLAFKRAGDVFTREAYPEGWALLQNNMGLVYLYLSYEVDEKLGKDYLNKAITGYREAIVIDSRPQSLENWASDQSNLGILLNALSQLTTGAEKIRLLKESVVAYNEALKFYSPTKSAQDWARTKNGLGNALIMLGRDSSLPENADYLNKAVIAFDDVLRISKKEQFPRAWAKAKNNRGTALLHLSSTTTGAKTTQYLSDAASSFNEALEVYDSVYSPKEWGDSWTNLGITFLSLANESTGTDRIKYFDKSIEAFQTALQARSFENFRVPWAGTQISLSYTLQLLADETDDERSVAYLQRAEKAARSAGEVYTENAFPQHWADLQHSLGRIYERIARQAKGDSKLTYLKDSEIALRGALRTHAKDPSKNLASDQLDLASTLYDLGMYLRGEQRSKYLTEVVALSQTALGAKDRSGFPPNWEGAYSNMGNALRALSREARGKTTVEYLEGAASAYRDGLLLRKKATRDWGELQHSLGSTLLDLSRLVEPNKQIEYLMQAENAFREALQFFSPERGAEEWGDIEYRLASVLLDIAMRTDGEARLKRLREAESAYESALQVIASEQSDGHWSAIQLNLGLTRFYLGMLVQGQQKVTYLNNAELAFRNASRFFTRDELPEQWETIQRFLARCYIELEKWSQASAAYSTLLQHNPDDEESYRSIAYIYHEKIFDFAGGFAVTERWLATHKGDLSSQSNFAENYFTTGRFSECEQLILALLREPKLPVSEQVPLRAIRIANMVANNHASQVLVEIDSMVADIRNQPVGFKVKWSFEGTRHFVGQEKNLALYRDWLSQLFDALQLSNDRDTLIMALQDVRASFKERGSFNGTRKVIGLHCKRSVNRDEGRTEVVKWRIKDEDRFRSATVQVPSFHFPTLIPIFQL
jgi:hypothetical protein